MRLRIAVSNIHRRVSHNFIPKAIRVLLKHPSISQAKKDTLAICSSRRARSWEVSSGGYCMQKQKKRVGGNYICIGVAEAEREGFVL